MEAIYQYPACLGLELAPAAAEVVLARSLLSTGDAKKKVLEDCLMGEEEEKSLELQLERDKETGMQVAKFFEDGVEVTFDNKIEPVPEVVVEAERALPKDGNIPVVLVLMEDVLGRL